MISSDVFTEARLLAAAVDVATSSLSDAQVIKYGTLGSGKGRAVSLYNFSWKALDDGFTAAGTTLATYNTPSIFVGVTDFNDGGGKWRYIMGQGARNNRINNLQGTKNTPIPAKSAFSQVIMNSRHSRTYQVTTKCVSICSVLWMPIPQLSWIR